MQFQGTFLDAVSDVMEELRTQNVLGPLPDRNWYPFFMNV